MKLGYKYFRFILCRLVVCLRYSCLAGSITYSTFGNLLCFCAHRLFKQVLPKSFGKSASLPLTAEIGLARVIGLYYQLRNTHCRGIQSLSHGYATSTRQCHMRPIRYTVLAVQFPLQKKKFGPSLSGDINARSSHWNNGKMKTAYNSAYVPQTDRWSRRQVSKNIAYARYTDRERRANNTERMMHFLSII